MARIRTIKPALFKHEGLFKAERETGLPLRLAFIGLFCQCDREGRFKWREMTLESEVLPFDRSDFSRVLDALVTRGFLVRYESGGEEYGAIPTFTKHQVVNNRESASELPPPPKILAQSGFDACATREARDLDENTELQSGREGNKEGNKEGKKSVGTANGSGIAKAPPQNSSNVRRTLDDMTARNPTNTPTPPFEEKKQQNLRAGEIAAVLREAGIEGCHARDDEIADWSRDPGVTNELLLVAVDKAKKNGAHRPGTRYLRPIVEDLRHPKPARVGGDWSGSDAGIERAAREVGITARPGESYAQFAERVRSKAAA